MIRRLIQPEILDYRFLTLALACFVLVMAVFYYKIYKSDNGDKRL
jgi:hypothetical protein